MEHWLITEQSAAALQEARAAGHVLSAGQIEAFQKSRSQASKALTVEGGNADIYVTGVLTKRPDAFAAMFGGDNTAYVDIVSQLQAAKQDSNVKSVRLVVDSGGGQVDGLFDALAAIEDFKAVKPLSVLASNAQSAAYAIAAMAGNITASGPASTFGSIGVAVSYFLPEGVVTLTNTDSPDKRPNLSTDEGKAVVIRHLDAINDLFIDAIARGRGTTKDNITSAYGRGATLLAGDAKTAGMIDSIQSRTVTPSINGRAAMETRNTMDLKTLKAQHPETFEAAVAEGIAKERDRVSAHITLAEQTGANKLAFEAINSGSEMTQSIIAQYTAAGLAKATLSNRQTESDAVGSAVEGAVAVEATATEDFTARVAAALEARMKGVING